MRNNKNNSAKRVIPMDLVSVAKERITPETMLTFLFVFAYLINAMNKIEKNIYGISDSGLVERERK